MNWEQAFHQEIEKAKQARQHGKEAMARVCARRAANILAQEILLSRGITPSGNAMQNFRHLQKLFAPEHPAYPILSHLLLKVNQDFTFPAEIDLIEEAQLLMKLLPTQR
ncbi:MAG: hypothetical protein Kow0088_05870 [Anaerolineales bacterium]